jgi:hypothetical protein
MAAPALQATYITVASKPRLRVLRSYWSSVFQFRQKAIEPPDARKRTRCYFSFAEAACLFLRSSERAKKWKQKQAAQHGEGKALAIVAARLGRAVYHILRKRAAFDEARFWDGASSSTPTSASSLSGTKEACHAAD